MNAGVGFDGAMIVSQTRETTAPSLFHDSGPALPRVTATPGRRRLDIPTIGVAVATYGGFVLLTWFFLRIPILIAAPLGALLLTWYGRWLNASRNPSGSSQRRDMLRWVATAPRIEAPSLSMRRARRRALRI